MVELYLLLAMMLASALVASETKDLLAAAVALGLVGFSVAIMFILVQAPDLAIVQIVVETLTVVFFAAVILRTTHSDETIGATLGRDIVLPLVTFVGFGVVVLILVPRVFSFLPKFGTPVMRMAELYIRHALEYTGAANVVAAIILDFRGYDTLGEATVLFTAVVGVLTVMRRLGRKAGGH
ncbi:MAG: hydrogen gas-evolving membrane-bound hydrogenase subunit E [candidate division WOR-3 bacterium]